MPSPLNALMARRRDVFGIAHGKAFGAVMLGMAGQAQMARAEQQAYFMAAVNGVFGGAVVPVPGGVLVRDKKGKVIGARRGLPVTHPTMTRSPHWQVSLPLGLKGTRDIVFLDWLAIVGLYH